MITSDYLLWLEQTAKSAGFDPNAARDHFNKGYGPGESSFDMRGQGSLEGAGEDDSGKRPQPNFGSRLPATRMSSRATTSTPRMFRRPRLSLLTRCSRPRLPSNNSSPTNNHFTERFLKEQKAEADALAKSEFDARAPMVELQKAVLALNERIDNVSSGSSTIAKSAATAS